jgi:hypothetical protein
MLTMAVTLRPMSEADASAVLRIYPEPATS